MSRRIDIELTSARPDGSWTWRAAGAREPKGVLDGALLYEGAKAGDVLKAEADFELEGIVIISVTAPKTDRRTEPQRIEVVGPSRPEGPGVTTQLVGRGDRRRDRGERGDRDRGRPPRDRADRGDRGDRGRPEGGREGRPPREGAGPRTGRGERRPEGAREGAARRTGEGPRQPARTGGGAERDRRSPVRTTSTSERARGRRLSPGSAHRKAVMDSLPPEQQPIAEHLLRGGIPAVRTALHLEREKAVAEGRPAPNSDELLALAESLLPRLRAAEWRDRAEAAAAELDSISLRDLRSVVAGADLARDDETRALGAQLREGLERRVKKLHDDWAADIVAQLDAGRVIRAVRLSGRAPDPSARMEPELAARLTEAASAMMSPETSADLWVALIEALAESPIRRSVTPTGLPADAPAELKREAHQLSGSIPALAKLLGVTIPPPPAPLPGRRRGEGGGGRPAGRGGRPPRPSGDTRTPAQDRSGSADAGQGSEPAAEAPPAPAEAQAAPGAEEPQAPVAPEEQPTPAATAEEPHAPETVEEARPVAEPAEEPTAAAEPQPAPEEPAPAADAPEAAGEEPGSPA